MVRQRLLDEAIERYVDWRQASATVDRAYGHWSVATAHDGPLSFLAYRAALDIEEHAATVYAAVIERLERLLCSGPELAAAESSARR
jgi:hypothetical protein